ncbi:MAG: endo alpha-1,4 polygalactosaminidase, partial [Bdellovibrionales bacterium]|nr:endo alpha-1,4 polygalactosaminidase [Bdellovibrionales bacterium]
MKSRRALDLSTELSHSLQKVFHTLFLALFLCLGTIPSHARAIDLSEVNSFAYQLQEIDLEEIAASDFDLVIMDYSRDGSDEQAFNTEEIETLRNSSSPAKKIIAYFSIGEAEDYRYYFKRKWIRKQKGKPCNIALTNRAPAWLDQANRNWCGNYKTRYWSRRWKRILYGIPQGRKKSYLDRIIDAGFDGIYLDIIDGFEYWKYDVPRSKRRRSAARDMANLVISLSNYAQVTRDQSEFIVIPQNGSGILSELDDTLKAQYLSAIDGIGAEDTYYFGELDENNPLSPQETVIEHLREFREAGKRVFAIDYLTDSEKISDFFERACAEDFIPQVSLRELNS